MSASPPISIDVSFTLSFDPATARLSELERDLRRESRRALGRALAVALGRVEERVVATLAPCARCGGKMRSRGRTLRRLITLFGALPVRRARYACMSCRAIRQPLDDWIAHERYGVYSRSVCEQALYLAAELSFERAAEVLRHVGGTAMSGRQIERVLKAESPRIAAALGVEAARLAAASAQSAGARSLLDEAPGAAGGSTAIVPAAGIPVASQMTAAELALLVPAGRFRRGGGASAVARLRHLKAVGRWNAYWSSRVVADEAVSTDGTATQAGPSAAERAGKPSAD